MNEQVPIRTRSWLFTPAQRARSVLQRQLRQVQMFCLLILKMPWHPATKLLRELSTTPISRC
jgi:hypothetical protein